MRSIMKVVLLLVGSELALSTADMTFGEFKIKFGKTYSSGEEPHRRRIFNEKVKKINEHNKGNHSYTLGINQFSDLTHDEFVDGYTGVKKPKEALKTGKSFVNNYYVPKDLGKEPTSKDYIKEYWSAEKKEWWDTWTNPVRDQGKCGSCWAFGIIASIEMQVMLSPNASGYAKLSEQHLLDCVYDGRDGCDGGWHDEVHKYIKDNGLALRKDYPYRAESGKCKADRVFEYAVYDVDWQHVTPNREDHLLNALVHIGPMAVAIHASQDFHGYDGGVLDDPHCDETSANDVNHMVTLVGYGTEGDKDYWLLRNSHGDTWGEHGYFKLSRHKNNHCRISEHAYIPILKFYFKF